ncbi:MAG: LysR family transcriptional regulator [Burkholderiales bacterium]
MLDDIKTFAAVAEFGSFSAAARVLGLSPSAVSRQIDKLESRLAAKLLQRSTRHLALTEAGLSFLAGARQLLADCDSLVASVQPALQEARGDLRISVFESFGRLYLCPLIADFLSQHPKVNVEVLLDNQLADLYRDKIDLAVRIGRPADSRLKARKLLTNRMRVCASPDYLARREPPAHPQALRGHNCLALSQARQLTWWHFARKGEQEKVLVKGNLHSVGGTPLLAGALKGLGVTLLASWALARHVESGELLPLLGDWEASTYEGGSGDVYAVFLPDRHMKPALRALIDFLAAAGLDRHA